MRSKVLLLALKYMFKVFVTITVSISMFLFIAFLIGQIADDKELGFIICFGTLALVGVFVTCYDIAKHKIDNENRDLMEQIARKQ